MKTLSSSENLSRPSARPPAWRTRAAEVKKREEKEGAKKELLNWAKLPGKNCVPILEAPSGQIWK